ncbi:MAG: hypothetical protein ABI597_13450 [Gammaproteobacteria bacterium]
MLNPSKSNSIESFKKEVIAGKDLLSINKNEISPVSLEHRLLYILIPTAQQ